MPLPCASQMAHSCVGAVELIAGYGNHDWCYMKMLGGLAAWNLL